MVGVLGDESFLARISLPVTLLGLTLFLAGGGCSPRSGWPSRTSLFMIPLPWGTLKLITYRSRLFDAEVSAWVLGLLGVPVYRDGVMLHLPNITLEVADACSSIPAIAALLSLGVAYAVVTRRPRAVRIVLIGATLPLAIVANIIRITSVPWLAYYVGPWTLQTSYHMFNGTVNFMFTFLLLLALDCGAGADGGGGRSMTRQAALRPGHGGALRHHGRARRRAPRSAQDMPAADAPRRHSHRARGVGAAAAARTRSCRRDPRAADRLVPGYSDGARTIWVAVGVLPEPERHPPARDRRSRLSEPGAGPIRARRRVHPPGRRPCPLREPRPGPARDRRVVILYWYQLPGGTIDSDHLYRARLMYNRIVHRRADGALVRVAAPVPTDGSPAQVIAQQAEFLGAFLPELLRSLPR